MDDTLTRISNLETAFSDIRNQVTVISMTMATKDDLKDVLLALKNEISPIRDDVTILKATIPHLATKADLNAEISPINTKLATIPHLATKADFSALETRLSTHIEAMGTKIAAMEGKIITWVAATGVGCAGLALAVAKLIH
jgi:hypothetical protein